jgi:tRNA dimethylallyltransferase
MPARAECRGGGHAGGRRGRSPHHGAVEGTAWRPYFPPVAGGTVIALYGPTGVGKTEVAIALADLLRGDGEDPVAVSADALQVYAGLETLTGAASAAERARLEHRLVSFLAVTKTFSAGAFARRAHAEIDALLAAGRRPIVVGGTGLYLRAALAELDLRPPPAPGARERWNASLAARGAPGLHAVLAERDPEAAANIAPCDAQRIVRTLELLDAGAPPPPAPGAPSRLWTADTRYPTLLAGLTMEREALYARIDARVDAMLAAGAAEEVRAAAAAGASATARKALGFEPLLRGDVEAMRRDTRRYAKRQLTWMRKLPGVLELDLTDGDVEAAAERVRAALRENEGE